MHQISSQGHALWLSSCESDSSWSEIPHASGTDSDVSCKKEVQASLNRRLVKGNHFRFCLTNSLGSWCETLHVYQSQFPSAGRKMYFVYVRKKKKNRDDDFILCFIDAVASPNDDFNLLKAAILVLFVVLLVVTMILFYFVKKKVMVTGHTRASLHAK